ncbi:MAG: Do family serine endopeptidase [bacterium]
MLRKNKTAIMFTFAILLGVIIGLTVASNFNWTNNGLAVEEETNPASSQPPNTPVNSDLENTSRAFVRIAKRVTPAVVSITSEKVVKVRDPFSDFFRHDDLFDRFFRTPDGGERQYKRNGLGSGVIVNSNGYILTNYHVVKEADAINVLIDKNEYDASIVGTDPATDVAVIKIEKTNLPVIALGNSDELEVGEWILAIGSPFSLSLEHTVTAGIISAKGRSDLALGEEVRYQDFIQTDAAINPGNSGGALVNLKGELIGINSAIVAGSYGGNLGIGFAIPINMAKQVMDELIAHGKVVRGFLGVFIKTPDADMREALGIKENRGAVVMEVQQNTPASRAGLKKLDVIVAVDGHEIEDSNQLTNLIASYGPGQVVNLKIVRGSNIVEIPVRLAERAESRVTTPTNPQESGGARLGLAVSELTDRLVRKYHYEDQEGVLVTNVQPGSVAEQKGIRAGDLIKRVNRKKVETVQEFNKIVAGLKAGSIVLFQIRRGSRNSFVAVKVPKP